MSTLDEYQSITVCHFSLRRIVSFGTKMDPQSRMACEVVNLSLAYFLKSLTESI